MDRNSSNKVEGKYWVKISALGSEKETCRTLTDQQSIKESVAHEEDYEAIQSLPQRWQHPGIQLRHWSVIECAVI
ncbi:hypothetical protein Tco_0910837 [Tanacetum coccineum]|uniref:Uncharacterized protein n=1 Tax=Tanacetum coccineum TaxID=301880 RepID=A0ABQ5CVN8_9ASTR